jgi:hypothetical protein
MESRIRYEVCPACGYENAEKVGECPACSNRLFSDGEEEHRRYVALITSEHRKRTFYWYAGWVLVAWLFLAPIVLFIGGKHRIGISIGEFAVALIIGWRLIDLKKKRQGSARFLAAHKNAQL